MSVFYEGKEENTEQQRQCTANISSDEDLEPLLSSRRMIDRLIEAPSSASKVGSKTGAHLDFVRSDVSEEHWAMTDSSQGELTRRNMKGHKVSIGHA
jgi:hypothetical protein